MAPTTLRYLLVVLLLSSAAMADVNVKMCVPEPGTTEMVYGDLINCEISPVADSDLFRFPGQAGELIEVFVFKYQTAGAACFRVIDPDGTIGQYVCGANLSFDTTVGRSFQLTKSGIYTIQVAEDGNNETMGY